jgi:hypothetical protein
LLTDLSPLFHEGVALVRPEDVQLKKGSWVRGSAKFPTDLNKGGWFSGKTFVVCADTILVDYPWSANIVNQDYAMLDLTNQSNPAIPGIPHPTAAQAGTMQMYPQTANVLYQISVGMKKGKYFTQLQIPRGTVPIYQMGSSAIPPNIGDPVYRYLGAKYPKDSPENSPTWFLYSILNAPQIVLNVFMDGGDTMVAGVLYGKATIVFRVNKCLLQEISLESTALVSTPIGQNQPVVVPNGNVVIAFGGPKGDTKIQTQQGQNVNTVAAGYSQLATPGWQVLTGSGSAIITTMDDVRRWQTIQERALYIPHYSELTGF